MRCSISLTCEGCGKPEHREYGWIDPTKYKNPNMACITSMYHCIKCQHGNAVQLKFLSEGNIEEIGRLDFTKQINYNAIPFYISHRTTETDEDEFLTEDALALKYRLNEVDVLELLAGDDD